jgi:hypothetical protein
MAGMARPKKRRRRAMSFPPYPKDAGRYNRDFDNDGTFGSDG